MKILVVDDERAIRNSLKEILGDEGYEVDTAEDGVQAEEMIDKEHYDVVFCDIKMPGKDGEEVLDFVASQGIDSAMVMISGHGDQFLIGTPFGTGKTEMITEKVSCLKQLTLLLCSFLQVPKSSNMFIKNRPTAK